MDIKEINKRRVEALRFNIFGIMFLVIGAIATVLMATFELHFIGIIMVIIGIGLIGYGSTLFSKLRKEFKSKYFKDLINEILPNSEYIINRGISLNTIYATKLLPKGDREHTEDLIKGKIEDVEFETCDLVLEEKHVRHTKNGTTVTYIPFFIGRFFIFDFNKSFKGNILLTETRLPMFFSNYKKVEFESVEFNEVFKSYTEDEFSAFYVITPHLMESLLELERNNPGSISMSFNSNKLAIALNNNVNTFELKMTEEFDEKSMDKYRKEVQLIKDIVEELRLNRKIFKEE